MMTALQQAQHLRPYIEKAMQSLPDTDALQAKTLYPLWEDLVKLGKVDTDGEPGFRFNYGGDLFKCVNGDPEFQADWIPGIYTAALYTRIDESHAGTIDDPIPYEVNMEIYEGLYYSQNGVTYLCIRNSGQPLYHDLSALVGIYVEVAE